MFKNIIIATIFTSILHASPERGEIIYKQMCFTCHGPNLEGGIGPSLNDDYWQHGSSPQAILDTINNGAPGTEMIAYKDVYPAEDITALRDFILSQQAGFREVVRSYYADNRFLGEPLTPELFNSTESSKQTPIPENSLWIDHKHEGGVRMQAKLYVKTPGDYQFKLNSHGRTVVYIDGEEVYSYDPDEPQEKLISKTVKLKSGTYSFDLLHESKKRHGWRVSGSLVNLTGGGSFRLHGSSLAGSIPKEIHAGPNAKVIRKWIRNIPPRSLLCLLPNKVIVSFNPEDGTVSHAWHGAFVNQTPSLPDRSAAPSEVKGSPISDLGKSLSKPTKFDFIAYETQGDKAVIHGRVDGKLRALTIAPNGSQSFTITTK
ncbi:MAG: c-type cytochrome [Rubritalea sp.]|uniref:c-type cytochrome n=1 Tax=Rubritalea sp. TaxID=2109375 RepID=UPI003241E574